MNCPECGKQIPDGAMTCPECGMDIDAKDTREITAKLDIEELTKEWQRRAEDAREVKVVTALGARTDLGKVRENNEDKFEFFQPEDEKLLATKGAFYAVADGMGGHSAGQIASELALKTTIKAYYADSCPVITESLRSAVQQANRLIHDAGTAIAERAGMGTTITALVIQGETAFIAQVGDSRCYRVRNGKITQITEDHSWVQEQVKLGGLTEEQALASPYRNVITRSLGSAASVEVDIYEEKIEAGDRWLLCSDGLSGDVRPDEMLHLMKDRSPSEAVSDLVDLALERGGHDNTTALILGIKEIARNRNRRRGLSALFGRS